MAYLSSISALALEPDLRPTASELLKHPFVSQESQGVNLGPRSSLVGSSGRQMAALGASCSAKHSEHFVEHGSLCQPSNNDDDDDMCRIDDNDDLVLGAPTRFRESLLHRDANQNYIIQIFGDYL